MEALRKKMPDCFFSTSNIFIRQMIIAEIVHATFLKMVAGFDKRNVTVE